MHLRPTLITPPPQTLMEIPNGAAGIAATLDAMRRAAQRGKLNPTVRQKASEIIARVPEKAWGAQIAALHAFVRDRIMYIRDPVNVETVREAERVLIDGVGDCDDKSVLLASMLEATGHPARFMAVGFEPGKFSHVYVEALTGKPPREKWIALESTEKVPAGWKPRNVRARMKRHV